MNVLDLCSGIGGLSIAVKLVIPSARTVCYVEGEAYAATTLVARMEQGPTADAFRSSTAGVFLDPAPIWSDVKTFDGRAWRGKVDLVTAGFPCQPFSLAGKGLAQEDERHLWPDIARIIREARTALVYLENVPGLLGRGLGDVLGDLAALGFDSEWLCLRAADVGAPHLRRRVFILAWSERDALRQLAERREDPAQAAEQGDAITRDASEVKALENADRRFETGRRSRRRRAFGARPHDEPTRSSEGARTQLADAHESRSQRTRAEHETAPIEPRPRSGAFLADGYERRLQAIGELSERESDTQWSVEEMADSDRDGRLRRRLAEHGGEQGPCGIESDRRGDDGIGKWPPPPDYAGEWPESLKPSVRRVAHGLPNRVDRLRALGKTPWFLSRRRPRYDLSSSARHEAATHP